MSWLVAITLAFTTAVGIATSAHAAAKPVIAALVATAGPLSATEIVIKGSDLTGADKVQFGSKKGTIVRRVSATEIVVKTPRAKKAGTVSVKVHTPAGWSTATSSSRYTFTAKPSLSTRKPTSGYYTGGTLVTLKGKNLKATTAVMFGNSAATIVSRTKTKLVVRAPAGVLGKTQVKVISPGGTSKGRSFTYVLTPRVTTATIKPKASTYVATSIQWVTGGWDQDLQQLKDWVVSIPKGVPLPTVGAGFLVKPGTAAFRSGLAGVVKSIAAQADDSSRVTVTSASLDTVLTEAALSYSGSATPLLGQSSDGQHANAAGPSFPIDGSALSCMARDGRPVSFGADLDLRVTDVDVTQNFSMGGVFPHPKYDATVMTEIDVEGKIHVSADATCKTDALWANTHRRTVFLGTTGLTLSIAPQFEFSVSAGGSFGLSNRIRTTMTVSATLGSTPVFSRSSRTLEERITGAGGFQVELAAGVRVQFGVLDRAGVAADLLIAIQGALEAIANPVNVCVTVKVVLKLRLTLFLDWIVGRWDSPALTASLQLFSLLKKCMAPDGAPPVISSPAITSARLPDGRIGSAYDATLTTRDGRAGTWSVPNHDLPAGLALNASNGSISGTLKAAVGDYAVIVGFLDGSGLTASTIIRIRVLPIVGLQGGSLQMTLAWSGPADLDLHATDPSNEEIYYRHTTAASGGELDHDANADCNGIEDDDAPVENIFWPAGAIPSGRYTLWVHVYNECSGSLNWRLTVRRSGVIVMQKTGTGDSAGFAVTLGDDGTVTTNNRRVTLPTRQYPKKA
ncbi:MAG TPA: IPT/TIG domain-containing protein [Propionicimonas sp.]|uniref:IPT/TIG domain-containing protein n=1 Tax=Propionicimonas sp. TaxID=1955623 RepID=UPI002F3EC19F